MNKIVFIGAGNLATRLSIEMKKDGFEILQVYSHTELSAQTLSHQLGCSYTTALSEIRTDADLYIFSVKDAVLDQMIAQIPTNNGLWVHTAGSMPMEIFGNYHDRYGIIYPLQTFTKQKVVDFSVIPFFIECNSQQDLQALQLVAQRITNKVIVADSEQRKYIHLAAVFACNFANHMFDIAATLMKEHGLPFEALLPLIEETALKVKKISPHNAQTGPAIRYDKNVMNRHIGLLKDERLKQLYQLISQNIHDYSNK